MATDVVNKYINARNPHPVSITMGSRTVEVRPVGAWVRSEQTEELNAAVSAQVEEERMRHQQLQKERKLKHFQEEVKKRVQKLEAIKRQQQLQNSYKAVENERNIIKQSTLAAEKNTSRKNSCTLRAYAQDHAIRNSGRHSAIGHRVPDSETHEDQQFERQFDEVHKYTSAARNKLISRRVMVDDFGRDNLPGGTWNESNSEKDSSSEKIQHRNKDDTDGEENGGDVSERSTVHFDTDRLTQAVHKVTSRPKSSRSVSGRSTDSHFSVSTVPDIYPGVQNQDERVQSVQQRAMYRRLFMDIEREQVREMQRRKSHHKKIHQLKKDKEDERQKIEFASLKLNEPTEEQQAELTREVLEQERLELELTRQEEHKRVKKGVEAGRYLEALKQTLREKMTARNVDLPALCCCGDTIWETNPDTCANNCVFYKNPKAFAKALQCVLASCDTA